MGRPPFKLSDREGRDLVQRVEELRILYPLDPKNHRPFCGAFIRALHDITGKLYGPDTYRRLLSAYVGDRNPSTDTLAALRREIGQELGTVPRWDGEGDDEDEANDASARRRAARAADEVRSALADFLPQLRQLVAAPGREAEFDFLTSRLAEAERLRSDALAQAARMAGQLQEQTTLANSLAEQLAACQAALAREQDLVVRLTQEVAGQRTFALQSIEASRGEARTAKERVSQLERDVRMHETTIDQLRIMRGNAVAGGSR